ncbi:Do family serine endopeptidase [Notoacmeibacter sp. MSK16QG-6]|uniref:Do family serine endopeptidase n=1 Tax=Notoacmeibacter sp. MSK16QG-6 TaxID=2957982 RepID=UPI0020A06E90|nr:Do family serine endopeptidase [Notoacmeibacter sp. MSK16QG-6]MCP1199652.1 Do family serine endopeptidase [Notoacmeibacter sp. MSK16QG-6]
MSKRCLSCPEMIARTVFGIALLFAMPAFAQETVPQPPQDQIVPTPPEAPAAPVEPTPEVDLPPAPPNLDLVPAPESETGPNLTATRRRELAGGPESVADLAEELLPAVVNISLTQRSNRSERGEIAPPDLPDDSPFKEYFEDFFNKRSEEEPSLPASSLGSGFVIDAENRYVVTNNHVIEGGGDITAVFPDGTRINATLRGTDEKTDLAVLQLDDTAEKLTDVKFGPSEEMRIGDWVMAIGNPFGLGSTLTVGIVSAVNRDIEAGPYDDFIQTDAAINRGNSGGPLFNMFGEVIGINTAIISPSGGSIGIGFSVPSDLARGVVSQLIRYGETRRGWLGVRIEPVTDTIAESLDLERAEGALVAAIIEPGPVDNGEILPGDIIVDFDGRKVEQSRDLPRIVADTAVGKSVEVTVIREGEEVKVFVELGRLEDADAKADGDDEASAADQETPDTDRSVGEASLAGVKLGAIDDAARDQYAIADDVNGALIESVEAGSEAEERGLEAGMVVIAIAQELVTSPEEATERLQALVENGRQNAFLLLSRPDGETFIETLPIK